MGQIPPEFTLEKLIGRELNQICIGRYDLQFVFDVSHVIICQGKVIVEINGQSVTAFQAEEPYWLDATLLPHIAGRNVIAWKVEGSHEFSITLAGEARLRFKSTDCQYEEFIIRPEMWIV